MIFSNFKTAFRNFHHTKDICLGLQNVIPAAGATGQYTCTTVACVRQTAHINLDRCLHTGSTPLVPKTPLLLQQKRHIRKVYPEPIEHDPYFYQLPEEDTILDIHHVPHLDNNGPELVEKVQTAIKTDMGRLFAVVHLDGEQRKITTEDLVLINGYFPPQIGDKIRLEKVMLVGSKDFTLLGRPLLSGELVKVEATVIEKTLSHVSLDFDYRKRHRRLKLLQNPQAIVVINSIKIDPEALE